MAIEVRPSRDRAEFAGALNGIWQYFAPSPAEDAVDRWLSWVGQERMHVALEDGEVAGGAGAFTFDFTVPGGSLPCAGVTAWNAFMSWSQNSQILAAYALAGGFATPLLLATGGNHEIFLFTYILAIDFAAVMLVRLKSWPRLLIGAFPAMG